MSELKKNKLIDERPLIVLPSLAAQCGLFPAIFIQQLHHNLVWIAESIEKEHDTKTLKRLVEQKFWTAQRKEGKKKVPDTQARLWYRCTPTAWMDEFPWSSQRTLKRTISHVRSFGVLTARRPGNAYDQTNYYSLDYDLLRERGIYLEGQVDPIQRAILALSIGPACPDPKGQTDVGNQPDRQVSEQPPEEGGGGDGADAPENQNIDPAIHWPDSIQESDRATVAKKIQPLSPENQQAVVDALAEKLENVAAGKTAPIRSLGAYVAGLANKARKGTLERPQKAEEDQRSAELAAEIEEIRQAVELGANLLVDGEAVTEFDGQRVWTSKHGCKPLGSLIARGAKIETHREAA